ncbi:MAG: DUF72 domain-containing protein [Desulfobacteraceae bacterium]|nr:MAG: DUF72 domain-containing protein [Desulfobacteraceae bacterium]
MAQIRIGTSGWSYAGWRGKFYPPDLSGKKQLAYVSSRFNSLEINGSFYSLLSPKAYRNYRETTPGGFLCAVKASRFITHIKRLKEIRTPLANFFASGVLKMEDKLGPILWQLPKVKFNPEILEAFLQELPKDTQQAARLAREHDERVEGKADFTIEDNRPLRHAVEFRGEDFFVPECVRILRRHGVALVFSHSGSWPYTEELTAGFAYIRLHGAPHTYASNYEPEQLDWWAGRICAWASGEEPPDAQRITDIKPPRRKARDVYVYFDNDHHAHAPVNAKELMQRLEVRPPSESRA